MRCHCAGFRGFIDFHGGPLEAEFTGLPGESGDEGPSSFGLEVLGRLKTLSRRGIL